MPIHSKDRKAWLTKLNYISSKVKAEPTTVFNNLGHVLSAELLLEAYEQIDAKASVGIDNITKEKYGERLESNITQLMSQVRKGLYRPKAARLVEIPKEDGKTRPLAISCFEDKLIQWAVSKILSALYEPVFLPCSYGFRPTRNCHDALRALTQHAYAFKDGAIVEIDIQQCFNMIPHDHLMGFLELKICDRRFLQLLKQLITIPITKAGQEEPTERGCPQGSILSPIMANIALHHIIDLWFQELQRHHLEGKAELIRYCDDMIFVFENPKDARRVWQVLGKRLQRYGLNIHPEKSSLMRIGSQAAKEAERKGEKMPTFSFLGFTGYWGKSRKGFWRLMYKSRRDRFTEALKRIRAYLRENLNKDIKSTLMGVVRQVKGWLNYHAISDNHKRVMSYLHEVQWALYAWFNRKGSKGSFLWSHLDPWLDRISFPKTYKTLSMFSKN
jgi:group II intron reverse transcriptase/maturase